ncbi:MAG: hypothetical protein M1826_007528 [Phylliscum demangeonii]|nr:MAG: hypothetical protein M1826_007528 [Phylliscum demangeonii]
MSCLASASASAPASASALSHAPWDGNAVGTRNGNGNGHGADDGAGPGDGNGDNDAHVIIVEASSMPPSLSASMPSPAPLLELRHLRNPCPRLRRRQHRGGGFGGLDPVKPGGPMRGLSLLQMVPHHPGCVFSFVMLQFIGWLITFYRGGSGHGISADDIAIVTFYQALWETVEQHYARRTTLTRNGHCGSSG